MRPRKWDFYCCEFLLKGHTDWGEGNGTPLQYSCLENPTDRGACWAAVHGVAKSRTRLHFHFSLSCSGEGNGNPLQCSCLGNPRDGGAWWAAVSGVTQSRTWLKRLSSSSSSILTGILTTPFEGYHGTNGQVPMQETEEMAGLGRSSGRGQSNPFQYCCLENPRRRSLVGYSPQGRKELDTTEVT